MIRVRHPEDINEYPGHHLISGCSAGGAGQMEQHGHLQLEIQYIKYHMQSQHFVENVKPESERVWPFEGDFLHVTTGQKYRLSVHGDLFRISLIVHCMLALSRSLATFWSPIDVAGDNADEPQASPRYLQMKSPPPNPPKGFGGLPPNPASRGWPPPGPTGSYLLPGGARGS